MLAVKNRSCHRYICKWGELRSSPPPPAQGTNLRQKERGYGMRPTSPKLTDTAFQPVGLDPTHSQSFATGTQLQMPTIGIGGPGGDIFPSNREPFCTNRFESNYSCQVPADTAGLPYM